MATRRVFDTSKSEMTSKQRHVTRKSSRAAAPAVYADESLSDFAYRALEKTILSGEIAPGIWITEKQVSSKRQISRTPVRDAIGKLMHARLIEVGAAKRNEDY